MYRISELFGVLAGSCWVLAAIELLCNEGIKKGDKMEKEIEDMLKKHDQEIAELKKGLETAFVEISKVAQLSLGLTPEEFKDILDKKN